MALRAILSGLAFGLTLATAIPVHADPSAGLPYAIAPGAPYVDRLQTDDQHLVMSPDYLQHIADWLQLNEPKFLQKTCATIKPIEREALEILTPQGKTLLPDKTIRLDRPESFTPPIAGAWIEKWWVDRCGQRVMRSMTVVRDRSGGLRSVALVPGESASDPLLVRDTIRIGAPAFMAALRSCTDRTSFQVIDTKVVAMRGPHDRDEDWTIAMCDQTAIIPITYSPGNATNPNGTGIIVGAGHKP